MHNYKTAAKKEKITKINCLKIGQAMVDITPPVNISMCGHLEHRFEGFKDRLYAQAVVFSQGRMDVCLITTDLIGFSPEFTRDVQARIARRLRVKPENVLLCATHTHRGPDVFWPMKSKNNIGYINRLKQQFVDLAKRAAASLEPASVGAGIGKASIGINRRLKVKGAVQFAPNPRGVYDRDVAVVKISSAGKLKSLFVSHACHPTSEEKQVISADYPGRVRRLLQKHYGRNVLFPYLLGCCGDVRPNGPYRKGKWVPMTEAQVRTFSKTVQQVAGSIKLEKAPVLSFVHSTVRLPLDPKRIPVKKLEQWYKETKDFMRAQGITNKNQKEKYDLVRTSATLKQSLHVLKTGRKIKPIVLDVAVLRIGRIVFAFLPGEVFTEIGLQIKRLRESSVIIPVSMFNVMAPYLCTARACREGGYEPDQSFVWYKAKYPFPYSGRCEKIIVDKIAGLLR